MSEQQREPLPEQDGFFWATHRLSATRQIVRLYHTSKGARRVETWKYGSQCIGDFFDWNGPLREDRA